MSCRAQKSSISLACFLEPTGLEVSLRLFMSIWMRLKSRFSSDAGAPEMWSWPLAFRRDKRLEMLKDVAVLSMKSKDWVAFLSWSGSLRFRKWWAPYDLASASLLADVEIAGVLNVQYHCLPQLLLSFHPDHHAELSILSICLHLNYYELWETSSF